MSFDTEPTGYEKTILSDLQGDWQCREFMDETLDALSNGEIA